MNGKVTIKMGRTKLDFLPVMYAIMMAPFFEPLSIGTFIAQGMNASLWNLVATIYTLARITISTYAYVHVLYTWKRSRAFFTRIVCCGLLYLLFQVIACVVNKTFTSNLLLGLYVYSGFVFLCIDIQRRSTSLFLRATAILFACLSLIGVITTFLYPNGFNQASVKAYAYYALGSKNASFFYFFMLVFAWSVFSMLFKNKLPAWSGLVILVLIAAAAVCNSGNSIICLAFLLVCNYLEKHGKWIFKYVKPHLMLIMLLVVVIVVYMGMNLPIIGTIVGSIGRDTTFTGRDALWLNAIQHFSSAPIFGVGQEAVFLLSYGAEATHAHSFYLDTLSKYGLVTAIPLFASLVFAISSAVKLKKRLLSNQIGIYVFVAMLHMVFDVPGNYFYLLLLLIVNAVVITYRRMQQQMKLLGYSELQD